MENLVSKHTRKALITGAAGFIGSHLCALLEERDWHVTALDLPQANWWRHTELSINPIRVEINLADSFSLEQLCKNNYYDCVFHLSAMTDVSRDVMLLDVLIKENIIATNNLLGILKDHARRIIITGTCEEYGNGNVPFSEKQREIAVSPYSWSKICVTHLSELYMRIFNAPVMVVRPFLTYGPLQTNEMLIPAVIRAALKNESVPMTKGEQTRDFNYVTDIVEGMMLMADVPNFKDPIMNLGSGVETSILHVVELIYQLCESSSQPEIGVLPYRAGETMNFYCDNQQARINLGWTPKISLNEGLLLTIDWYRDYLRRQDQQ